MNRIRLSQQEADPIGGVTAAPVVAVGAALALVVAVVSTVVRWDEVGSPLAAVVGILFVGGAGLTAALSAAPSNAPFTLDRLYIVVALATAAAIAEFISTVGNELLLYGDYGPVVIGLLILCVAPFCSWTSLLLAGGRPPSCSPSSSWARRRPRTPRSVHSSR